MAAIVGVSGGSSLLRDFHRPVEVAALVALGLALVARPAVAQSAPGAQDFWQRQYLTGDWGGERTRLADQGIVLTLQQQSELWGNAFGGLRRGVAYDGLLTASVAVDLEKAVGWRGASLFASGYQVQGVGPTVSLVGALQSISNLEAVASDKLYDLWLQQQFLGGKFSVRIGQEGANDEFMLTQYGALLINSSFGFPPLLALDLPGGGPNYPLAAPFARVEYRPNEELTLLGAVYSGDPAPAGTGNPQLSDLHGTDFRLNDHSLSFAEMWYSPAILARDGQPGTYKLGMWIETGPFADPSRDQTGLSLANPQSSGVALQHATDHGFYAVVDQMLWKRSSPAGEGVGLFVEVMHAPGDRNLTDLFVDGGLNWMGPLPDRSQDSAGLAVTYAGLSTGERQHGQDVLFYTGSGMPYSSGETVVEATYRAQLAPWLQLQPDVQFVINPGAGIPTASSAVPLKNDLIFGARITIVF